MQINCHVPNGPLPIPKFGTRSLSYIQNWEVAVCPVPKFGLAVQASYNTAICA